MFKVDVFVLTRDPLEQQLHAHGQLFMVPVPKSRKASRELA